MYYYRAGETSKIVCLSLSPAAAPVSIIVLLGPVTKTSANTRCRDLEIREGEKTGERKRRGLVRQYSSYFR